MIDQKALFQAEGNQTISVQPTVGADGAIGSASLQIMA
jgi:hypothetical protein